MVTAERQMERRVIEFPNCLHVQIELVDGSSYFGLPLPFSISTLVWIEVLLVGSIEFYRNAELDPERRLYPGGKYFDPLNLAADPEKKEVLKLAEIKHARLAMVAALGFAVQAAATGKGPLDNWATHLSDPLHTTIFDTFSKWFPQVSPARLLLGLVNNNSVHLRCNTIAHPFDVLPHADWYCMRS